MGFGRLAPMFLLAGANACATGEKNDTADTDEVCNVGVNSEAPADVEAGMTNDELLAKYGVPQAVRMELFLGDSSYASGTIESPSGDTSALNCLSDGSGSCYVDLYSTCDGQSWSVELREPVAGVECTWVIPTGATAPTEQPSCAIENDGTLIKVSA